LWDLNENTRDYITLNGFDQNLKDTNFSSSKRLCTKVIRGTKKSYYRSFHQNFIKTKLINGKEVNRNYIVYSNRTGKIYCAPCRLFNDTNSVNTFANFGFCNWKKCKEKLSQHENSINHKNCVIKMKNRGNKLGRIDSQLILQVETEIKYWKEVLTRIVAVVKSLSSRGLSFRSHNDKFGSTHSGNFIMCLELIAEFDPFLANHISKFGNKGKGSTSYLSFSVYEKFIEMMGEKVKNTIINEIKNAKYFSIVVDSTPDISHTDQLACIFRYVKTNGEPVERFLQFITNSGHKSEDLADAIFMVIGENELDIKNCRGQSYDNASNMSGVYSGLQARIKGACPYAIFVPCAAHSLNLVGEYAANCCTLGTEFFNFLQALYTFFSASTYRWEILSDYLTNSKNKTVKRLSDTRWAARHEACSSLSQNWTELLKALNSFVENPIENSKTKCESTGLIKKMNRLEMCILVSFWNDILERFNSTSKKLQTIEIDLTIVINLYTSLINYVTDLRNTFSHYEKLAMEKSEIKEYKVVRKKKRKIPYDESCQGDTSFEARESFKINTYFVIIDSLLSELRKRKSCYDDINTMFGFFSNMIDLPVIEVRKKATKLQSQYPEDLDGSFINECIHFHGYLKSLPGIVSPKSILELCKIIEDHNIADVYPYVDIALRMYLCCPVSNTSAERSFSVLKRVKSYLRSSMNDNRLNNLAILNIECEITKSISYNEVIEDFAAQKSHRKI